MGLKSTLFIKIEKNSAHKDMYVLVICNHNFVQHLVSLGITPRKASTIKMIGYKFNPDFLRGIIEGDGNIRNIDKGDSKFEVKTTSGSIEFINQIKNFYTENNIKS